MSVGLLRLFVFVHAADNNFTSFQRQLNLYGFKRVRNHVNNCVESPQDGGKCLCNNLAAYKGSYIYSHPLFVRHHRELCDRIRRTSASSWKASDSGSNEGADFQMPSEAGEAEESEQDLCYVLLQMRSDK